MDTYLFRDDGCDYVDEARCIACRAAPADVEIHVDGKQCGYVCHDCLRAAHRGGAEGWRRDLQRRAKRLRLLADFAERTAQRIWVDADCRFELEVRHDAYFEYSALGTKPIE